MMSRAVGHEYPAALHRIRIGSGRSPLIRRSDHIDRHPGQLRQAPRPSRRRPAAWRSRPSSRFAELAGFGERAHFALRIGKIARGLWRATSPDTLASTRRISACVSGRAFASKPPLHHFGRARQQFAKQVVGNVGAQRDRLREHRCRVSALRTSAVKPLSEICAPALPASLRFTVSRRAGPECRSPASRSARGWKSHRDVGALRVRDFDQIGGAEPRRLRQHRAGHHDVVVLGQPPHHCERRIFRPARAGATIRRAPCSRSRRSACTKTSSNRRTWSSLKLGRAVRNSVGDLPQRFGALFVRTVLHDVFEFGNQRRDRRPFDQSLPNAQNSANLAGNLPARI